MNKYTARPTRALTQDFTQRTLARSIKAKSYGQPQKDFLMNIHSFLKRPAGLIAVLSLALLTTAGAYAAVNWFNGNVGVKTDSTIMNVDISSCKNPFLPGFPDNQDMRNVQFKILGEPHISETNLKQTLLTQCESNAVADFYHSNPATKDVDLHSGAIVAVGQNSLTLAYVWGGQTINKSFDVGTGTTFYNQGTPANMNDIKTGQFAMFATPQHTSYTEGTDPLQDERSLLSLFVTQYNTAIAPGNGKKNFSYPDSNIMPLGMYEQLHKK